MFMILFHSQINDQIMTDYSDLKRFEIMCLNGRLLNQTFMSLSQILWKIWDNAIADVIHFCLTYLDLRYLMIGSVFPRLFLMMMFEVPQDNEEDLTLVLIGCLFTTRDKG